MRKVGWIAAAVFAADRVSKLFWSRIPAGGVELIPGVLGLNPVRNTGMAFSLFSGHPWALGVLSLLIIAGAFLLLRGRRLPAPAPAGLMMMLGGALGNLTDRLLTGFVPDMIELRFVRFAVFNVADAFLVLGCGLAMLGLLRKEPEKKTKG